MNIDLLSWGANSHHQLSHVRESEQCTVPTAVDLNDSELIESEIKKIVGGGGHTTILNEKGEIWACGLNDKGQTGVTAELGVRKYVERFEKLNSLLGKFIVDVACGWDSSAAIDEHGNLYLWGSNAYGQLGIVGKKFIAEPTRANLHYPISRVAMGLRHSAVVTTNGDILVAGSGNKCQLGIIDAWNNPLSKSEKFIKVPGVRGIKSTSCGQRHTLASDNEGNIYAWGDNKFGQIGVDTKTCERMKTPYKLENVNFRSESEIFTGWTHNVVLCDGKVSAWGRNSYGELGRRENEFWIPKLIGGLPRIVKLAVGSEHNVALSENGTVLSWGWNEHGNCGNGTEQDVQVPEPIKVPESKNLRGILVGAGAGHSFAVFSRN